MTQHVNEFPRLDGFFCGRLALSQLSQLLLGFFTSHSVNIASYQIRLYYGGHMRIGKGAAPG